MKANKEKYQNNILICNIGMNNEHKHTVLAIVANRLKHTVIFALFFSRFSSLHRDVCNTLEIQTIDCIYNFFLIIIIIYIK